MHYRHDIYIVYYMAPPTYSVPLDRGRPKALPRWLHWPSTCPLLGSPTPAPVPLVITLTGEAVRRVCMSQGVNVAVILKKHTLLYSGSIIKVLSPSLKWGSVQAREGHTAAGNRDSEKAAVCCSATPCSSGMYGGWCGVPFVCVCACVVCVCVVGGKCAHVCMHMFKSQRTCTHTQTCTCICVRTCANANIQSIQGGGGV